MKKYMTCAICGILAFLASVLGVFGNFNKVVEDAWYHNPETANENIRIIKIDEKTMNQLGDYSTWDRDIYAGLIETLCVSEDVRPAVIGFDILFSGNKDENADKEFAQTCEKYDNVVCAFSYVFRKELTEDGEGNLLIDAMSVSEKVVPFEELEKSTSQGFVNALMDDRDGYIRSALLQFTEKDGTVTKSFSAVVYEKYMEAMGEEIHYPTKKDVMSFRYSGGVSEFEAVSLCDVLDGTVPAEAFDDCIVLIGAYAQGMMDSYFVPVDRGQQMYGVEIHANIIQAIMEGKNIETIPVWVDGLVAAFVAVVLVLVCHKRSVLKTVIICLSTVVVKLVIDEFIFEAGYFVQHLTIPVMALLIGVYYVAVHYYKARAAKASIEKAFSKYVAPQVVKEIAKNGTYELKLGGEKRDIAVLFVDIRGFTTLSENMEPEQVVSILNRYLEMTTACIFKHGGTLDKFIGDATMAVFNAPFDTDDYVYKAVHTAWDIVQGGKEIEKEFKAKYNKEIGFGVGVNCGPAVVGNIGCEFRMDYTAIGDTVNTAARLEANAPKGTVYISDAVYEQIKNRISVNEIGEIPLKGKSKGVNVYAVTGMNG